METAAALEAQASYARSFNTPGLNRFAEAVEKIAVAITSEDQDAYFLGILNREEALTSLSPKERNILSLWDGRDVPWREFPREH